MKVLISRLFLILILFSNSTMAGIFDNSEYLEESRRVGNLHKAEIMPGKILVFYSNGNYLDFASAQVMTPKGHKSQTKSVLSCAHTYNFSVAKDPNCIFIFIDSEGSVHEIESVTRRSKKSRLKAKRDIALYHLKNPIKCNPLNDIAKPRPKARLSCLSYGWMIASGSHFTIENAFDPKRSQPYFYSADFIEEKDTFVQYFDADRIMLIHDQKGYKRFFYLAKSPAASQTTLHDSGTTWYTPNEKEGVSFCALSSVSSRVHRCHQKASHTAFDPLHTAITDWLGNPVQLDVYELENEKRFYNKLTNLASKKNRKWLYKNIKA